MKESVLGLVICGLIAFGEPALAQDTAGRYVPGGVVLKADRSLIVMPPVVERLFFDTAQYDSSWNQLPSWRFLGELKVDSLRLGGSIVALTSEAQMEGIVIGSAELSQALRKVKTSVLLKGYPNRVPADTLYWDSIRVKWHKLPDPSIFYEIRFDTSISLDWVKEQLEAVPGLAVGRRPVIRTFEWLESSTTPWYPDDSAFRLSNPDRNWALTEKQPNNTRGISAPQIAIGGLLIVQKDNLQKAFEEF